MLLLQFGTTPTRRRRTPASGGGRAGVVGRTYASATRRTRSRRRTAFDASTSPTRSTPQPAVTPTLTPSTPSRLLTTRRPPTRTASTRRETPSLAGSHCRTSRQTTSERRQECPPCCRLSRSLVLSQPPLAPPSRRPLNRNEAWGRRRTQTAPPLLRRESTVRAKTQTAVFAPCTACLIWRRV